MTAHLYGIPNCDTVKKAREWLDERGVAYVFHDYKKEGADPERLARWAGVVGWEKLLNKAGTTFRKLPDEEKAVDDAAGAVRIMAAHPSTIRRPVIEHPGGLLVGFRQPDWETALA